MAVTCASWPFRRQQWQQVQFLCILWVAMVRVRGAEALTGRFPKSWWVMSCAAKQWYPVVLVSNLKLKSPSAQSAEASWSCFLHGHLWEEQSWTTSTGLGNVTELDDLEETMHINTATQIVRGCHFRWVPIFPVMSAIFHRKLVPFSLLFTNFFSGPSAASYLRTQRASPVKPVPSKITGCPAAYMDCGICRCAPATACETGCGNTAVPARLPTSPTSPANDRTFGPVLSGFIMLLSSFIIVFKICFIMVLCFIMFLIIFYHDLSDFGIFGSMNQNILKLEVLCNFFWTQTARSWTQTCSI